MSGGLHGVGASVVNACYLSGWRSRFIRMAISIPSGLTTGEYYHSIGENRSFRRTGTVVRFKADPEIFKEGIDYVTIP